MNVTPKLLGTAAVNRLIASAFIGLSMLPLSSWASEDPSETILHSFGKINDPYFGQALYYYYKKDFFQALSQTLVAFEGKRIGKDIVPAQQLLGELYLVYGLHTRAEETLKGVFSQIKNNDGVTTDVQNHAWLDLAQANYKRGLYDEARRALAQISGKFDKNIEPRRKLLEGNLLLANREYQQAANVLDQVNGDGADAVYARYNRGIALLNAGRFQQGIDHLDRLGRDAYDSEELRALKDRANLAVGFLLLRAKEPEKAIPFLQRVRLNGVHANKAMLGIGWAKLIAGQYEQALVSLTELLKRPTSDAAVLEGYLAVPFAYSRANATAQAIEHYEKAVALFESELKGLDDIERKANKTGMLAKLFDGDPHREREWLERVDGWPKSSDSRVFTQLITDPWFNAALTNYQDLKVVQRQLSEWRSVVDVYDKMLATRRNALDRDRSPVRDSSSTPQTVMDLVSSRSTAYQELKSRSKQEIQENAAKVKVIRDRVSSLLPEVKAATVEHEQYLKRLVLAQVGLEKTRINGYLNQGRLALAQLYERVLNSAGGAR